jgi:hypothetical protein
VIKRIWAYAALAASLALVLSACAGKPSFDTPIRWQSSTVTTYKTTEGAKEATGRDDVAPYSIELQGDGIAELTKFPEGKWRTSSSNSGCFVATSGIYSGKGTWEFANDHQVRVRFGNSDVIFRDNGQFGDQDWSMVHFGSCVRDQISKYWELKFECGDSGPPRNMDIPCRPE